MKNSIFGLAVISLLLFYPSSSYAKEPNPNGEMPDLRGTVWQGMSFPEGTVLTTQKHPDAPDQKYLVLPSGVAIGSKDSGFEICQKKCTTIDQEFINEDKTYLTWKSKKEFEWLVSYLSRVTLDDNEILSRRKYFSAKGWETYQNYINFARKAFKKELSTAESFEDVIEGSQQYRSFGPDGLRAYGEKNVIMYLAASRVWFKSGGLNLGGRALTEIFVLFKPVENPTANSPKYLIVSFGQHIFLNAP